MKLLFFLLTFCINTLFFANEKITGGIEEEDNRVLFRCDADLSITFEIINDSEIIITNNGKSTPYKIRFTDRYDSMTSYPTYKFETKYSNILNSVSISDLRTLTKRERERTVETHSDFVITLVYWKSSGLETTRFTALLASGTFEPKWQFNPTNHARTIGTNVSFIHPILSGVHYTLKSNTTLYAEYKNGAENISETIRLEYFLSEQKDDYEVFYYHVYGDDTYEYFYIVDLRKMRRYKRMDNFNQQSDFVLVFYENENNQDIIPVILNANDEFDMRYVNQFVEKENTNLTKKTLIPNVDAETHIKYQVNGIDNQVLYISDNQTFSFFIDEELGDQLFMKFDQTKKDGQVIISKYTEESDKLIFYLFDLTSLTKEERISKYGGDDKIVLMADWQDEAYEDHFFYLEYLETITE